MISVKINLLLGLLGLVAAASHSGQDYGCGEVNIIFTSVSMVTSIKSTN
jgi:hypothetical protein